jgi:hypothetical protein
MNILHALNVVILIPDLVFPKATLPHSLFLFLVLLDSVDSRHSNTG